METKTGEIRVAEIERKGGKKESRKKARRKEKGEGGKTEKTKEGKNDRHKKDSARMGDMEEGGRSSKVGGRG